MYVYIYIYIYIYIYLSLKEDKPTGAGPGTYDPNASMGQSIAAGMKEKTRIGAGGAFGSTKTGNRFAHGMLDKCTKNAGPDAVGECSPAERTAHACEM